MPRNGAGQRAEQAAALEAVIHQRMTDPQFGDLLDKLEASKLSDLEARNVAIARSGYNRATKVPVDLAVALARMTPKAQGIWAAARAEQDFQAFAPVLTEIVALKRQEAETISENGQSPYDALLNDFEPGMDVATLNPLLESMRPRLSALREKISQVSANQPSLTGHYPKEVQLKLVQQIAGSLGYDFDSGRLDLSTHPFSSGTGGDSRITTRVDEADPLGCLYSTIHEVGHSLYEQGLPNAHSLLPIGQHVSMGVHESQSRLWENQIGRSRAFCEWLYPHFVDHFGVKSASDPEQFYRMINRVETGYIRTEADEVHYNLHVLLRFELERDLIGGSLDVVDLEEAWNSRFERDFGISVPHAALGVLQDVHWSVGLFGYFPTYSLGTIYSGQINARMRQDIPSVDTRIRQGDTQDILEWLRLNVHQRGSILPAKELMEEVVEQPVSAEPLLDYLETKFGEMFEL